MILPTLACPECGLELSVTLACGRCLQQFQNWNVDGKSIPVLYHRNTQTYPDHGSVQPPQGWLSRLARRIPEPSLARFLNADFFDQLKRERRESLVLNLGAGDGQLHPWQRDDLGYVHLDLVPHFGLDVIADAHHLPFLDETFDAVFSNSALEHVLRPWVVAEEIFRVLKPGGRVYVQLPFLVPVHHEWDLWRFTDQGIRMLFDKMTPLASGVSAGPSCALAQFLNEYLMLWAPRSGLLRKVASRCLGLALFPLVGLDRWIARHPQLRVNANSFYFVGQKP